LHAYTVAAAAIAANRPLNDSFNNFKVSSPESSFPLFRIRISDEGPRYRYDTDTCLLHSVIWEKGTAQNEPVKSAFNPFLLKHRLGFLFHSSFLESPACNCLIIGESGAGKSTLTMKLAPFLRCGNDDLNVVRPKDGILTVHSTPFCNWEKAGRRALPFPVTAEVRNIFLLEKERNAPSSVEPVTDGDAIWRYLFDRRQIILPQRGVRYTGLLNDQVTALIDSGKFFLLRHNLNDPAERVHELIHAAR
jgi:hypothetical protein